GTADRDVNRDPPGEEPKVKTEGTPPTTALLTQKSLKKQKPKALRKNFKAPADSDSVSRDEIAATWSDDQLEKAYNRNELRAFLVTNPVMKILQLQMPGSLKGPVTPPPTTTNKLDAAKAVLRLLKDAGKTLGSYTAKGLLHLDLETIQITLSELFEKLKVLVGEAETQTKGETKLRALLTQLPGSVSPTGSSQHSDYASATSMADSDTSEGVERMQLGPSEAAMLQTRSQRVSNVMPRADVPVAASRSNENPDRLETFFNSAMERFLKEQRAAQGTPAVAPVRRTEPQDVDMESVGSDHGEYDPDDLDLPASRQATEPKEFPGKDEDEDRARAWIGKVKSAFVRDQAPDDDKCLVLGSLFTGSARNWYRQLSRTTRSDWKKLLREFQVQFCGLGVSVARQYYHARKRTDETPLEYLYRLNVEGLRAKLRVKSGPSDVRREHVEHFIETLNDRDLADQLALLRISDALEEVLRARQRAKNRQGRAHFGSSKYRQKAASSDATKSAPTRKVQAVVTTSQPDSDSDSGLSGSESDGDLRRINLAATEGESQTPANAPNELDRPASGQTPPPRDSGPSQRPPHGRSQSQHCTHCGSHRRDDLHCWKRLTCQRCGKT
ncbi:hypothetical protein L914_15140, partial [Phytophthora nicotianae]